jgi:hypothetical protein
MSEWHAQKNLIKRRKLIYDEFEIKWNKYIVSQVVRFLYYIALCERARCFSYHVLISGQTILCEVAGCYFCDLPEESQRQLERGRKAIADWLIIAAYPWTLTLLLPAIHPFRDESLSVFCVCVNHDLSTVLPTTNGGNKNKPSLQPLH